MFINGFQLENYNTKQKMLYRKDTE